MFGAVNWPIQDEVQNKDTESIADVTLEDMATQDSQGSRLLALPLPAQI